jgi:two-component system, NtrC family, nitrogen regulation sensor histidine kinase NtrY
MDRGFSRTFVLLEELTEELRHAEKAAYEKLIRMLSHEVNNSVAASNSLLTSCLVYAEQLPGESRTDLEGALQVVMNRTAQLGAFMKAFADVVRLPEPRLAPCDLHDLLSHLSRLMAAEAERRRIRVVTEFGPVPPVQIDRTLMEQALVNVIKNAIEAVDHDGTVTLRTGVTADRPWLQVEDSGHGLDPEVRAHLFTPFFSTKESGQGIGLTLVQEILTRHGFAFTLDGPTGGPTQFTIWFG